MAAIAIILIYSCLHSWIYINRDKLQHWLAALHFLQQENVSTPTDNFKFFDQKDLISSTGQIFVIVLFAFVWYAPYAMIRRMVSLTSIFLIKSSLFFAKFHKVIM